nr:BBE domain-containing protein [Bradyrhizobium sp. 179]
MRPHVPGKAYINYCDSELRDWPTAYWGPNLTRLEGVKRAVDPTNIFRFPQSIPPVLADFDLKPFAEQAMQANPAAVLPSPDFTCTPPGCVFKAGVRPYRRGTYRLEIQPFGSKHVIHNYGHGGAGITMSWGCADAVVKFVQTLVPSGTRAQIAVLGAGVMGLTAATLLAPRITTSQFMQID